MHPLVGNLKDLTDTQLEEKVMKLNRVYFIATNEDVRRQIILLLDELKLELESRYNQQKIKMQQDDDNDLDGLINVS